MKTTIKSISFLVILALSTGFLNARSQPADEFYKLIAYKKYNKAAEYLSTDENQSLFRSGYLKLKQGNIKEAEIDFLKGIEVDVKEGLHYAGLGAVTLLSDENNTLSADYFDKALQLGKKNADVYFIIADAYSISQLNLTEGLQNIEKAIELAPDQSRFLLLKGDILLAMKDAGKAVSAYEDAIELDRANALPHYKIGKLYLGGRNIPRAEEAFSNAVKADPLFADVYKELAEIAYSKKDMNLAGSNYRQYIDLAEMVSIDIKGRYGYISFLAKSFVNAISAFDEVLKVEPQNALILKYRAYALSEQNANEIAEDAFNQYFALVPVEKRDWKDAEMYGKLLLKMNKTDEALEILSEALAGFPSSIEIVQLLGETTFKLKKYDQSASYYSQLIGSRKVAHAQDYYILGRSYFGQEQFTQADSAFTVLTQLQPTSIVAFLWKARSLSNLDPETEKGLAKPAYEKVIELAQADENKQKAELEEAHAYLGYYYYLQKELNSSLSHWQMVAKFNPENKQAIEAIKTISN